MAKTSGTSEDEIIGTNMDNVENRNIDRNSENHTIVEHQNIYHSIHLIRKSSNLSVSNQSVSSTSAQKTLRQYFMNNSSK